MSLSFAACLSANWYSTDSTTAGGAFGPWDTCRVVTFTFWMANRTS